MRIKSHNNGFTLIEMSITMMILCVATLALAGMLIAGVRCWRSGLTQDSVNNDVTIAMQKISTDIRDGVTATVGTLNGVSALTVTFPATMTDHGTGETIYDLSGSGTTTRSYYVQNGDLVRSIGGVVSVIGKGVTYANFGASGGSVTMTLETSRQAGASSRSLRITGQVRLRNFHS